MSDTIIRVEGLGKRVSIRHQRDQRYVALRDVIADKAKALFRRNGRARNSTSRRGVGSSGPEADLGPLTSGRAATEDFWALKNVSFEVRRGEVLGIIGRNGAGKTTLLKILSRITEPTEGRVRIRGRVASLLEVGTGFHPELTGRENIYLNGAILGMSRAEIKAKFDEIVAFAETEKFLDTPVKRYSSGMYVRLAFAVAAHLEPEILIVDEVLAVGDAEFQKKCLGKMQTVSQKEGRTVLFVSHNMAAVTALCGRGVLLRQGHVQMVDKVANIVEAYLAAVQDVAKANSDGQGKHRLDGTLNLAQFHLSKTAITTGDALNVIMRLESSISLTFSELSLLLYTAAGQRIAIMDLRHAEHAYQVHPDRPLRIKMELPQLPLVEGDYYLGLFYKSSHGIGEIQQLRPFSVLPSPLPDGRVPYAAEYRGFFEIPYTAEVIAE